ncbi:hypothetical protein M430DRAFT_198564 [Amorphotheca resinae ATCC 22711]|jgi:hypothetical protein|uniref:Uncharacterized protein n=1 Tax=Amorphotheca resinae ATCC 22711 TaxID=857342 RepID=A0A2T3B9W4_AMORE|nr:hypothetical protein M430DRAFT_198564 [Amorphotheca resinae ATCC 22711]PSS25117.1 hypothetical protein M430DRAFT_198564 [Amorphotheca resinae ATCC 22711]
MDFTEFDEKKFSDVVSGSWDEDTAAFVKLLKQASLDVYKELLAAVSMEPLVLSTKNNFSIPSSMPAEVLAAIKAITIKFA